MFQISKSHCFLAYKRENDISNIQNNSTPYKQELFKMASILNGNVVTTSLPNDFDDYTLPRGERE